MRADKGGQAFRSSDRMLKIKLADESGEYVYMDICGSAFAYSFIDRVHFGMGNCV